MDDDTIEHILEALDVRSKYPRLTVPLAFTVRGIDLSETQFIMVCDALQVDARKVVQLVMARTDIK